MKPTLQWLTDPTVFQVNRLAAHSDHVCFAPGEDLTRGDSTSLRQSLDGLWRFAWSSCPAERPADFWREDFDDAGFGTIPVPGHMELQGYGQIQYINTLYPWDGRSNLRPPQIDWDRTAVGSYVTVFDLEPGLREKRVCISFQGVERAFYLWLNGHFIGYGEDSFTPSDFDLTPYIREKGNRLCVEVYQHSSASWLEDQDFFRFTGIFRSVYLYAKPESHLEDLWLQPRLAEDLVSGSLTVRLKTSGADCRIRCRITDPQGQLLLEEDLNLTREGEHLVSQDLSFPRVRPWDHGDPALYHILLTLYTEQGRAVEAVPYRFGFRRLELKDRVIHLNGKRLTINGVNRHEWNPRTGRTIGPEDMARAMETFRKNNINAVRTCHYPNQSLWYHLCDENGIYMMDEANLESHGSWQKLGKVEPSWNVPGSLPQWRDCVVDRAKSMFERDKNHVSILFWSCGNESYAGADILAMADFFRGRDQSRLVHYEGCFHNREFDQISDVESRMYASPGQIRAYLENDPQKPFLLCEYMHDMGNSLGGMESYIRLGEEFPMYQGGFIWDYMDQALWQKNVLGQEVLGYGGDFGDRQTDYAFSGNGIVFADGREKPAMQEVRYWYASPKERQAQDEANRNAARALTPLSPRESRPLSIVEGDGAMGVTGEGFSILFSYPEGGPVSLVCGGREWLWRAPRPAYWRASTENDIGCGFDAESALWSAAEAFQKCTDMEILEQSERRFSIRFAYSAAAVPGLKTEVTYTVHGDGSLDVKAQYFGGENRPELPLFGLRFATPVPVETTQWTGLSGETYPDRKKGGAFGVHREVPHIPDYLVPQECGCHMDTWETSLHIEESTLTIRKLDEPYAFSAIPYTPWQLQQAFHAWELPKPARTVVTLCKAMRGVGGIDSWGANVEEACRVSAGEDMEFSFQIDLGKKNLP